MRLNRPKTFPRTATWLVSALALICCAYLAAAYLSCRNDVRIIPWGVGQVVETKTQLDFLRFGIDEYVERRGHAPNSVDALRTYLADVIGLEVAAAEYISDPNGNTEEHQHLDGTGGWFYDPNTGTVKVNLTEPVVHYYPGYEGKEKGQQPSSW